MPAEPEEEALAMEATWQRTMRSDLAELPPLLGEAEAFLDAHAMGPRTCYLVCLVLEELITNTIKYGYEDASQHSIAVDLLLEPSHVVLRLVDDGRPFNPLDRPAPQTDGAIEDRKVGGLGIHLVRSLTANMSYRREADRNLVEVRFARDA